MPNPSEQPPAQEKEPFNEPQVLQSLVQLRDHLRAGKKVGSEMLALLAEVGEIQRGETESTNAISESEVNRAEVDSQLVERAGRVWKRLHKPKKDPYRGMIDPIEKISPAEREAVDVLVAKIVPTVKEFTISTKVPGAPADFNPYPVVHDPQTKLKLLGQVVFDSLSPPLQAIAAPDFYAGENKNTIVDIHRHPENPKLRIISMRNLAAKGYDAARRPIDGGAHYDLVVSADSPLIDLLQGKTTDGVEMPNARLLDFVLEHAGAVLDEKALAFFDQLSLRPGVTCFNFGERTITQLPAEGVSQENKYEDDSAFATAANRTGLRFKTPQGKVIFSEAVTTQTPSLVRYAEERLPDFDEVAS